MEDKRGQRQITRWPLSWENLQMAGKGFRRTYSLYH